MIRVMLNRLAFLGFGATLLLSSALLPLAAQARSPIEESRSQIITVSGKVIDVVGNRFVLDDGTNQITIDAGPRWWREVNVTLNEELTVIGALDSALDSDELDAFSIARSDGTVIQIRPTSGPPPWTGRG